MEEFSQFFKSFATVTQSVLLVTGHLCECYFFVPRYENRVIAETCCASGLAPDTTFGVAKECPDCPVWEGQGHAADESGTSFLGWYVCKFEEKLFVIFNIVPATRAACISGREHPRSAPQSVHFQTRIVGKSYLACAARDFDSFFHGVPFEGVFVLNHLGAVRVVIEGKDGNRQVKRDPLDFFDLFFISRGEDDFHKLSCRKWIFIMASDFRQIELKRSYIITKDEALQEEGRERQLHSVVPCMPFSVVSFLLSYALHKQYQFTPIFPCVSADIVL